MKYLQGENSIVVLDVEDNATEIKKGRTVRLLNLRNELYSHMGGVVDSILPVFGVVIVKSYNGFRYRLAFSDVLEHQTFGSIALPIVEKVHDRLALDVVIRAIDAIPVEDELVKVGPDGKELE